MRAWWALLPVLLLSCGRPDTSGVHLIGHGGLGEGKALPMNSAASLLGALELGVNGIEIDVQLTADSVLVAYHAQDLTELSACAGLVHARTYAELRQCPVAGGDGSSHPIERLDSLLSRAARQYPGTDFTLDCKLFATDDWWVYLHQYANALADLSRIPALQSRLVVECQVDDFLLLVQRKQPYLTLFRYAVDAEEAIWRAVASRFAGIVVSDDRITAEQVAHAQDLGLQVTIFGVGSGSSHRRALRKAPDRLQSDAPEELVPKR
jgi:glycerophosphoryl diester phosphodiesterase